RAGSRSTARESCACSAGRRCEGPGRPVVRDSATAIRIRTSFIRPIGTCVTEWYVRVQSVRWRGIAPRPSSGKRGTGLLSDQQRARIFGVLFLITIVTSIPALALYQPVLDDPVGFIASGAHVNQIYLGALLELLLIIANIGTAVVIFPVVKRQSEEL